MPLEISKEAHKEAIASIQRYFEENMEERVGNLAADSLLRFFLGEVGPVIYNKAIADAQERLQARVIELDGELHEEEFRYWLNVDRARRKK